VGVQHGDPARRWAGQSGPTIRASRSSRRANRDLLCGMVGELMFERTMHEWIELLEVHNVPCGSIRTIGLVLGDPLV
jgi:crotonobetainyl-CoA:carnitine CoA-transferase CaiB-like acyl-CoA transferase